MESEQIQTQTQVAEPWQYKLAKFILIIFLSALPLIVTIYLVNNGLYEPEHTSMSGAATFGAIIINVPADIVSFAIFFEFFRRLFFKKPVGVYYTVAFIIFLVISIAINIPALNL